MSVAMYPGAMAFTLIPCLAHSLAMALVSVATAPFDAEYDGTKRPPYNNKEAISMSFFSLSPPPHEHDLPDNSTRLQY